MSGDHISRNEFDQFMDRNIKTQDKIADAIAKLVEYTIRHDGEHGEINRRLTDQGKLLHEVREAILAQQSVTQFWTTIGKYGKYSLIGALTALGAYFGKEWFV